LPAGMSRGVRANATTFRRRESEGPRSSLPAGRSRSVCANATTFRRRSFERPRG
jgi:hypothetical protein